MREARARTWITAGLSVALAATAGPAAAEPLGAAASSEQAAQGRPDAGGGVASLGRGTAGQGRVLAETDRILVTFKDQVPTAAKNTVLQGAEKTTELADPDIVRTTGTGEAVVESEEMLTPSEQREAVAALEADPAVESAEPDQIVVGALAATPARNPNDTHWKHQWGPRDIGVPGGGARPRGRGS